MLGLGTALPDFDLPAANPEVSGDRVSRADLEGAPLVVVFTCNHCPYAIHVEPRLIEQSKGWIERGVNVIAISSNDADAYPADSFEEMSSRAARLGYPYPYLYDESQDIARAFSAACTPEFYLFDADGKLAYRGRLDDGRFARPVPSPVTTSDLEDAVTELLETGTVTGDQIPSIGCNIKWRVAA